MPDTGNLTPQHLDALYSVLKKVIYVHHDDLNEPLVQPLLKECREHGYEIVESGSMVRGKALLQNAAYVCFVDFDKKLFYSAPNTMLDFLKR